MAARSDDLTGSLSATTTHKKFYQRIEPTSEFPYVGILLEDEFFKDADEAQFTKALAIIQSEVRYLHWRSKGNFNHFTDKFYRLLDCIANSKKLIKFSTNAYEYMSQPECNKFSNALIQNDTITSLELWGNLVVPKKNFDMLMQAIAVMQRLTFLQYPMRFQHYAAVGIATFINVI